MNLPEGVVEVVTYRGRKIRHLAQADQVPASELVAVRPIGCGREIYVERVRTEDAGAAVCGRCWVTLPGVVEVRLIGPDREVQQTLAYLRMVMRVDASPPQRAGDGAHARLYCYADPAGELS